MTTMTVERQGQLPFGDLGIELVTDLDTGEQILRPKKARKSTGGQVRQVKRPAPTRQWWEVMGLRAFNMAAEGWKMSQAVKMAEAFGHNVEFAGAQMSGAETEGLLRKAFRTAQRSSITAVGVVDMMKAESLRIETRLGVGANWLPPFVDSAIDLVAEVYKLNQVSTRNLKKFAHQRDLPRFS